MDKHVILIADDSRMIRKILFDNLTNQGFQVIESENGDIALTLTLQHKPDLIISDINMPVMDGFDFCWSVKTNESVKGTPFIFLTTRDEVSDKVRGQNLGAAEYMNKPFEMNTLLPVIERLLQKRKSTPPPSPNAPPQSLALSGDLSSTPVTELLQVFSLNSKSGKLYLKHRMKSGIIYFQAGNIINAHIDQQSGTKALDRLIGLEEGSFSFEEGVNNVPVEMEKNTLKLLIEGLRHLDEMKPFSKLFGGRQLLIPFNHAFFEWGIHESTPVLCQLLSDIVHAKTFEELLDINKQSDLDICKSLELLTNKGLLQLKTKN